MSTGVAMGHALMGLALVKEEQTLRKSISNVENKNTNVNINGNGEDEEDENDENTTPSQLLEEALMHFRSVLPDNHVTVIQCAVAFTGTFVIYMIHMSTTLR